MLRSTLLATLLIAAACGGDNDGDPVPSLTPAASPAVYLSIGDSIQYGCCADTARSAGPIFRDFLASELDRPVEWITTAGNDTANEFVSGLDDQRPQLERAVEMLQELRGQDRDVVAITMSIGGNDYIEVGEGCPQPPCLERFTEILERMRGDLETIYATIVAAKDASTPLFVVTYYNATDCGQPGVEGSPIDNGQRVWNSIISDIASRHGAIVVDGYTPFQGRACELIVEVDPNYAGYEVLANAYIEAWNENVKP
jgi:lysophospholipase L1-like esterase